MRRFIVMFLMVALTIGGAYSQKAVEKSIDAQGIKGIAVQGDQLYRITIKTHDEKLIYATAFFEGENQNDLLLVARNDEGTITFSINWNPAFNDPNDKLSAHKMISAGLEIIVPGNLQLDVKSDQADLIVNGQFDKVRAVLREGNCDISGMAKSADIVTVNGSISARTESSRIETHAKDGNVIRYPISKGPNSWRLKSVNGQIFIRSLK
ncbi:MAG: hypothetical protein KJO00_03650 [Bacteroidia bacterium]|nr:hypothetical protein [Bacteroidia bacterium]NNK73241.1 hypothetical protein [Flavobacteriaceae bacterium]